MLIEWGRAYRIVVCYPWGEQVQTVCTELERDADGTIHWPDSDRQTAFVEGVIQETDQMVLGWYGGHCDVTVVISEDTQAPRP